MTFEQILRPIEAQDLQPICTEMADQGFLLAMVTVTQWLGVRGPTHSRSDATRLLLLFQRMIEEAPPV